MGAVLGVYRVFSGFLRSFRSASDISMGGGMQFSLRPQGPPPSLRVYDSPPKVRGKFPLNP